MKIYFNNKIIVKVFHKILKDIYYLKEDKNNNNNN